MDKTFCIFGDSVVQAAYVRESWVESLRKHLEVKYPDDFINVFNLGIGGNTTEDLLKRFDTEAGARSPTAIIIAVGVNDSCYIGNTSNPIVDEKSFKTNLELLIQKARKFSSDITLVGPTLGDDSLLKPYPGSSKGKSYDSSRVNNYNQILKAVAKQTETKFINLINKLDYENFSDGLHPNEQGHKKIFENVSKYF